MHCKGNKPATAWRVFAACLGSLVIAGLFLPALHSPLFHSVPALVFAGSDPNCQMVEDATDKQHDTPYRLYGTSSPGPSGSAQTFESVYVEGILYTQYNGQWVPMAVPPKHPKDKDKDANAEKKNLKQSCPHLRDEPVNGEDAGVYSIHSETEKAIFDQVMWISKGKGLPLRMEVDTTIKSGEKSHLSTRYEYDNVQKPK